MLSAYVLIGFHKTQPEDKPLPLQELLKEIKAVRGVKEAHFVYGDIDGIAYVEAKSPKLFAEIIREIGSIPGVAKTDTRIIVL